MESAKKLKRMVCLQRLEDLPQLYTVQLSLLPSGSQCSMSGLAAFRRVGSPAFVVAPQKSSEKALYLFADLLVPREPPMSRRNLTRL